MFAFFSDINPAAKRYADFLEKEYLPAAREATAIAANPNGAACYDASVLYHSSSPKTAKEVHALGLQQMDVLTAEMKTIGERAFHTGDVAVLDHPATKWLIPASRRSVSTKEISTMSFVRSSSSKTAPAR